MPAKIVTVRDHIAWSYANLARAHAAINDGSARYLTMHHMIRAKLFKGLRLGTMAIGSIYDDERAKMVMPRGCAYCGDAQADTIDHLIPRKRGGPDVGDNLVLACRTCNSSKGGSDLLLWYVARGAIPNLMLLRRYLKLVTRYCTEAAILDLALTEVDDDGLPFALSALPYVYPPLQELRL